MVSRMVIRLIAGGAREVASGAEGYIASQSGVIEVVYLSIATSSVSSAIEVNASRPFAMPCFNQLLRH